DLGVPVAGLVARTGEGLQPLLATLEGVAAGSTPTRPLRAAVSGDLQRAVDELVPMIEALLPGIPNARWIAIRLLDGDAEVEAALASGRLSHAATVAQRAPESFSRKIALDGAQ